MKKQYRWKFLREGMKSNLGDCVWKIGEQKTFKGELIICEQGFHCSKNVWQALSYVRGEILARVEVSGRHEVQADKEVWEKMKVVKAYKWQKKDSVELAIYAAELVISIYEKEYPNDDRPRKAIEAAKKYSTDPTEDNRLAAEAAAEAAAESAAWAARAAAESAAWAAAWAAAEAAAEAAAWAARAAAESAAWAARAAARAATWAAAEAAAESAAEAAAEAAAESARAAAEAAARAATWAARAAAWAARAAAESAAWAAMLKKIAKWMDKRVTSLEEIK